MHEANSPAPANHSPLVSTDYRDLLTAGVVVELPADEAEALGAFEEDALDLADAWAANADVEPA